MIAVIALTRQGAETGRRITEMDSPASLFLRENLAEEFSGSRVMEGTTIYEMVADLWKRYDSIVFVAAAGIAVRAVAPLLKHKSSDPAVVVVDEKGKFVIPILSGHIGGANRLASKIAEHIGGTPVITTASDVNGIVAFDEMAAERGWKIENLHLLKHVTGTQIDGGKVGYYSDMETGFPIQKSVVILDKPDSELPSVVVSDRLLNIECKEPTVFLRPSTICLGVGCRRDTPVDKILKAVEDACKEAGISTLSLGSLATIPLKADEPGMVEAAKHLGVPFLIIDEERVAGCEGDFRGSEFVEAVTGGKAVASPCALLSAEEPELLLDKFIREGVTVSVVRDLKRYSREAKRNG